MGLAPGAKTWEIRRVQDHWRTLEELMRKPGLAATAIVSMTAATLLASHAQAVSLRGAAELPAAMAALDISPQVYCYGCGQPDYCGCGQPGYCGCGRPYYSYYYPPRRYYGDYCCGRSHHDWGPYLPPEALNWGVHTRWADDYTQY
jgi:hypothetical protein